jgi:hypothetical protein
MSDSRADQGDPAAGFDQTNGAVQGLEGESGGTADGEETSPAERNDTTDGIYRREDEPDTGS